MYGNPQQQRQQQQQQLPGSAANFGMLRNNRAQGNASPGLCFVVYEIARLLLFSIKNIGSFFKFSHVIGIFRLSTAVNG